MLQRKMYALFVIVCSLTLVLAPVSGICADKININTATATQLQKLPGVGPALAKRIVKHRKTRAFTSVEQIKNVPGIGQGRYKKIKGRIAIK